MKKTTLTNDFVLVTDGPNGVEIHGLKNYYHINYDSLEEGECPICSEPIEMIGARVTNYISKVVAETEQIEIADFHKVTAIKMNEDGTPAVKLQHSTISIGGYEWCPACKLNWSDMTDEKLIEHLKVNG